jgi:hypothetical protein
MDAKGIETVRRDNCLLVRNVVSTCLDKLLAERDVKGAVAYVKEVVSDLLMNRLDLSLLVVSKGIAPESQCDTVWYQPTQYGINTYGINRNNILSNCSYFPCFVCLCMCVCVCVCVCFSALLFCYPYFVRHPAIYFVSGIHLHLPISFTPFHDNNLIHVC